MSYSRQRKNKRQVKRKRKTINPDNRFSASTKAHDELWIKDTAFSSSISPIAFTTLNNKIILVNKAFLSIWDIKSHADIAGADADRFWRLDCRTDQIMRKLRDKGGWIGEVRACRENGKEFSVQMSATMLTDRKGKQDCVMCSFVDITKKVTAQKEQKLLMRQLQERIKELSCLYAILSIQRIPGNSLLELLRQIVLVIPSALQWPEKAHAKIVVGALEVHTPRYHPSSVCLKAPLELADTPGFVEIAYDEPKKSRARKSFLYEEKILLKAAAGEIVKIIEQKKTEEKLRINREHLLQADKMSSIGALSAGVIHEINNPNNYIAMNARMLSKAWTDIMPILDGYYRENGNFSVAGIPYNDARTEIQKLTTGIQDGSERIKEISARLRAFATTVPRLPADLFDINKAVEKAVEFTRYEIQNSTRSLIVRLSDTVPPVAGNARQIVQVLINLITNACQALSSKNQAIRIATEGTDEKPPAVKIIVEDEGRGIPSEDLPFVTNPFFSTKRDKGGIGLGLSISNDIVTRHNGKMRVQSETGKGTRVEVLLPVNHAQGG